MNNNDSSSINNNIFILTEFKVFEECNLCDRFTGCLKNNIQQAVFGGRSAFPVLKSCRILRRPTDIDKDIDDDKDDDKEFDIKER
jgi:hypothetical protein